ncbi:MAG TPA: DUF1801 domain-containing protein [Ignavibacteriaceae bacterium]|nr:DUF1801 domain-containing protein [Ignavibacteriaceae bacterium]
MSDKKEFKSVKEYLDSQPEKTRKALLELKESILKVVPNATELLNYNIPAYALTAGGKREQQIMIAGYKSHVGLYPHPTTMERFDVELKDYKKGKGSVQFQLDKPLPKDLIERMVEYRKNLLMKGIKK